MTRILLSVVVAELVLASFHGRIQAQSNGDYRSKDSGDWSNLLIWETFDDSTWQDALLAPTSLDGVITLRNGHTVSVATAVTVDQVVVDAGATLVVAVVELTISDGEGVDLSVSGTVRNNPSLALGGTAEIEFNSGGLYQHNFTETAGTIPTATWHAGSTCEVIGYTTNSTPPSGLSQPFHHFTWNTPSQQNAINAVSDTITVKGDFTVTSTGSGSLAATVRFSGTAAQALSSAGTLADTTNLVVDNSAGVFLESDLSVNNLVFIDGNLYLGEFDLTIGGTVTGAAATQCVVTENGSTGSVIRTITASGSFQFPVAPTDTSFNPVTLALASGDPTETFRVRVESGVNPSFPDNNYIVQRTMDISETTPGGNNVTLTFQWTGSEEGSSFERASAEFYHYDTSQSAWEFKSTGTLAGSDPYTLTSDTTLSDFSRWSTGNSGGLPVEMTAFTASTDNLNVTLAWSTATEVQNSGWSVERREIVPGTTPYADFTAIAFVAGAGTSASPKHYTYADLALQAGRYAYRLKQIDHDGAFSYSHAAEVEVGRAPKILTLEQNYPNPFNPSTTVTFTLPDDGAVSLRVFNILGQQVASLFDGPAAGGMVHRITFDASGLPAGLYYARLEFNGLSTVQKMLLVK